MSEPRWLTPAQERAWRGYVQLHTLLDLLIVRDLGNDSGLSDTDYTVLAVLSEAPDRQLRMIDLAQRLLWSNSRLSHQLSRMQRRGLVRRDPHPDSQRACMAALTEQGMDAIRAAAPQHVESVRRHFIDLLTEQEVEALADITEKVVGQLRETSGQRP